MEMNPETKVIFENLFKRYPVLEECRDDILAAYWIMDACHCGGGKFLCCGNGGSSADCDHLVGELMKGFLKKRPISDEDKEYLGNKYIADGLQSGFPAISLTSQSALMTAFSNDCDADLVYAQQVYVYANENDVLFAFSTSGNSKNVVYALEVAASFPIDTIAITGKNESKCSSLATVTIRLPETETYKIQELTLPVYHCLSAMLEATFCPE